MKSLDLHEIIKILDTEPIMQQGQIWINKVKTSLKDMDSHTLIFHLHKTEILHVKQLEALSDCYIVTDQPLLKDYNHIKSKFILVLDCMKAYEAFINYYRHLFSIKTVGITGTCGKTTTKEMIKQVLEKNYHVTGTISSRNSLRYNHDYLMDIDDRKAFGIYEMALTDPGNIIYSAKFFKPTIGLITNIGIDHLSGCKTFENYILAKGEMLSALENKGTLIINGDCKNIKRIDFSSFKGRIITFGLSDKVDFKASNIHFNQNVMDFTLHYHHHQYKVSVPGFGVHTVYNALGALAVLTMLGCSLEESIIHLKAYKPMQSHFEFHKGIHDSILIDDTWSSNPTSMKAAFEALQEVTNTKVAVLGNISYLGQYALQQAKNIGKMAVRYQIDYIITIDSFSEKIGKAAIDNGMNPNHVFHCRNDDEIRRAINELIKPKIIILFKTSMFDSKMRKIIKHYKKD